MPVSPVPSRSEVERILGEPLRIAPVGGPTAESALPLGPSRRGYVALHQWGERAIMLQVFLDARGRIDAIALAPPKTLPRDPTGRRQLRARLVLPFHGTWWVVSGGPTEQQNHHVVAPDQRHAYDLVVWRFGATHRGLGTKNADYWAWGKSILAPTPGVVVAAMDGIRDNRPQVQVENRNAPAGNHVVLDLGNGEYALLAHMHRPGLFGSARGLPASFVGYRADGRHVARGTPVQSQFIRKVRRGS